MTARPRGPILRLRIPSAAVMAMTLGLAAGGFVATPATAQLQASNLSGRWSQESVRCSNADCRSAYDFVPCGDGWCGIEVKDGTACGPVAFRLAASEVNALGVEFAGRFERAPGTETYAVRVNLRAPSPQDAQPHTLKLSVLGNTGDKLELYRRTFPLHMVLRRDGEPSCKADPKLS